MTDRRRPVPSPLVATLARIIRAVEERDAAAAAERRATLSVVNNARSGGRAA